MKKIFLSGFFLLFAVSAHAEALKVVTTQAFYADLVRRIGGDRVEVKSVASPKFNVHFIQPRPSDVRDLARADLAITTGLDLEPWWGPLAEAAGRPEFFSGREQCMDMSRGIRLREVPDHPLTRAEGDIHLFGNPHFIMDPENLRVMAQTVADKLKELDPADVEFFEENRLRFNSELESKISEWRSLCAHCSGQEVLAYHNEIEYLVGFLGIRAEQFLEPKPGVPPTPRHLLFLEQYVKSHGIKAIILPTYFPRGMADVLAKKTGAKVVVIAMNVGELPGTDGVFTFFDRDIEAISNVLK